MSFTLLGESELFICSGLDHDKVDALPEYILLLGEAGDVSVDISFVYFDTFRIPSFS